MYLDPFVLSNFQRLTTIISAFFTAVQTFQAIPFYVSNKGLPRINSKGLLMKSSILLPITFYMFVYQRKNLVFQQESFRTLFHAQLQSGLLRIANKNRFNIPDPGYG